MVRDESESGWRAILASARRGDPAAREQIHSRFAQPLTRFLRSQVGKKLERAVSISDLTQESFLRAFDALEHLPSEACRDDFQAMLFRNARWVVGTHARKHDRFAGESAQDDDDPTAARRADVHPSSGTITRQDELRWFSGQVAKLGPEQEAVVRLRMAGSGFDEIARELGISEQAARKRFLRAAVELRRLSEGHLDAT